MEVAQENDIAFDQPDKFRRLFKSGPQHLLGSRHNTARTKSGRTTGTRMFQASCSAALWHQVFAAGVPSRRGLTCGSNRSLRSLGRAEARPLTCRYVYKPKMKPPKITEEKLRKLMCCFVADFENKHCEQLDKLSAHDFFLTERMGCTKVAGLNYEYVATTEEDKTLVTVGASAYVSAVKTLEGRELVKFSDKNPLIFNLTAKGFSETKTEEKRRNRNTIEKFLDFCKEHPGAVKLMAGIIVLIGVAIKAFVEYT